MNHPMPGADTESICRDALEFCSRHQAHPMAQALRRNALAISLGREHDKLAQLRLLLSQAQSGRAGR